VSVDAYDAGRNQDFHMIKFAALAQEVCTTPATVPRDRVPFSAKSSHSAAAATRSGGPLKDPEIVPRPFVDHKARASFGRISREARSKMIDDDGDIVMAEPEDLQGSEERV
jgi:kinesin family member 20